MARLTDEEFRAWCQRNKIEPETAAYIQRNRPPEPLRKVRGRASNVSGRYPGVKMGLSIQFESQHVELWGIYSMERDDDVLEMYDQPARIQLHYHARSGRKTSPWHTPVFLVLRRDGAAFEKWKKASSLDKLADTMPERYQHQTTGRWKSPPGEIAARSSGLSSRLRTSAEYHPLYIENLKFLQDFWTHPFHLAPAQEAQVLASLDVYPRVSDAQLVDAHPGLSVDVVMDLAHANCNFYRSLSCFSHELGAGLVVSQRGRSPSSQTPGYSPGNFARFAFPLGPTVVAGAATIVLRPEIGAEFRLPSEHFQHLIASGEMKEVTSRNSLTSPGFRARDRVPCRT